MIFGLFCFKISSVPGRAAEGWRLARRAAGAQSPGDRSGTRIPSAPAQEPTGTPSSPLSGCGGSGDPGILCGRAAGSRAGLGGGGRRRSLGCPATHREPTTIAWSLGAPRYVGERHMPTCPGGAGPVLGQFRGRWLDRERLWSPPPVVSKCRLLQERHKIPSSLIFLKRFLVFPILLFSSISLHWSLREAFLYLLAILWYSVIRWIHLSFPPLPFTSLLCSAICKASSDNHFAFCISFSWGEFWLPPPVQCHEPRP